MSSSDPQSLISLRDTPEDIRKKINKAHCPEGEGENNPVLMIAELLIFPRITGSFVVKRPEKFGGDVKYADSSELKKAYTDKKLFPLDLKNAVAEYLVDILEPVRKAFA